MWNPPVQRKMLQDLACRLLGSSDEQLKRVVHFSSRSMKQARCQIGSLSVSVSFATLRPRTCRVVSLGMENVSDSPLRQFPVVRQMSSWPKPNRLSYVVTVP